MIGLGSRSTAYLSPFYVLLYSTCVRFISFLECHFRLLIQCAVFLATEQIETPRCVHQLLLAKFQTGRVQKYRHQEQEVAGSGGSPRHQGLPDGEEGQLLVRHREDRDGESTL